MVGLSNYTASNTLSWMTGAIAEPSLPSVYLALFTAVGTNAGTGFTEVSGGSYARVQVAGNVATNGSTANGNATLHFSSVPAWVVAGMYVYDTSTSGVITTDTYVVSTTGTTVVLSANVTGSGVNTSDNIVFSAFANPTGTAPTTVTNNATITFAAATGSGWGTVIAFGLYDSFSGSTNLLCWDFIGAFNWIPWTCTSVGSGNGAVFMSHAHGFLNGTAVVVTNEFGGTLPTVTQEGLTGYEINYVANGTTDTFTLSSSSSAPSSANAVWTTTTGDGDIRQIVQQAIPAGITASFAPATFTASMN